MGRNVMLWEALFNRKKYFCLAPYEKSLGNAAEEIFLGLMVAKMTNRQLVIISRKPGFFRRVIARFRKYRFTNAEMFDLDCPGVVLSRRDIVGYGFFSVFLDHLYIFFLVIKVIVYKVTRFDLFYNKMFSPVSVFEMPAFGQIEVYNPARQKDFSWAADQSYGWEKYMAEQYPLQLSEQKNKLAAELRVQMGLPADAPFVCLHVRDGGFHAEAGSFGAFRNSDIALCEQAVDLMISRGFRVVRLGDARMKPAPFKRERFIDYPFTPYKSELLDLYLIRNCELFIGTDSGPVEVGMLFQKKMLYLNLTNWPSSMPVRHGDLGLIKYYYSKSRKRFLSVRELLEEPCAINLHYHFPENEDVTDYIIFENTSADIRSVVAETLDQGGTYVYNGLQDDFVTKRRAQGARLIATDPYFKSDHRECYRLAFRMRFMGTLGRDFLNRNWEYGDYLKEMTAAFQQAGKVPPCC
ncbi:MAG: TIGR04372 family glycosyltransferase [Candidatus Omnitrophica bacterium]|nr:TIGR04372 family glycosyltransferase [Candidatus Omnitrophota bacterium]